MITLTQKTSTQINREIAQRLAGIRKRRKISQKELSIRADVSYASLRRFEQTGEISLHSFTKLAIALELEDELDQLFTDVVYRSIEELINDQDS